MINLHNGNSHCGGNFCCYLGSSIHQQGNQELHEKQEEAMIPAVLSWYNVAGSWTSGFAHLKGKVILQLAVV